MNNSKVPDYMRCLKRSPTLKSELGRILQPLEDEYNQSTDYEEKIALVNKINDIVNSRITELLISIVSYENSNTTNDPNQDTLYEGKMRKAQNMANELHKARAQKELSNCLAIAQLKYVNQEIAKRDQGIIYPQELRAKFIDIFNKALKDSTNTETTAKIIEDRDKFVDNQDEMLNCRAIAQLKDINQKIAEIEKDEETIFPTSKMLLKFTDAFDQALSSSTKAQTVFKIIEDREKFIDNQVSKITALDFLCKPEKIKNSIIELVADLCNRYPEKVKSIFTQNGITKNDLQEYKEGNEHFKMFLNSFEETQTDDLKSPAIQKLYLSGKDSAILESIIGKDAEGRKLLEEIREFITSMPEEEFIKLLNEAYVELEQESKNTTREIETPDINIKRSYPDFDEGKTNATDGREIKKAKLTNPDEVLSNQNISSISVYIDNSLLSEDRSIQGDPDNFWQNVLEWLT